MKKLQSILIIGLAISSHSVLAQNNNYPVITTAVPFLRISADARASGMGSTGIATAPDPTALYYNIGKLPFTKEKAAINTNYAPWLKEWSNDMFLASLGGYYKLGDRESLHGLIRYFNPGAIQFTDNNGNHLQSYHPNEYSIDLGYSRKLSDRIGVGLSLKYIRSDLARGVQHAEGFKAGKSIAADLGFYYDLRKQDEEGWSVGAQLSNLGSKLTYSTSEQAKDFIPANLGLGTSYTKVFDEQNKLLLAFDVNKLLVPVAPGDSAALVRYRNKPVVSSWLASFSDGSFKEEMKEFQVSTGMEYWYNNQFALRAGYFYEDKTKGDRSYFSVGSSIKYHVFTAHFAYLAPSSNTIKNPLASTLMFGLAIHLDQ